MALCEGGNGSLSASHASEMRYLEAHGGGPFVMTNKLSLHGTFWSVYNGDQPPGCRVVRKSIRKREARQLIYTLNREWARWNLAALANG